jgi:hypothetical protein
MILSSQLLQGQTALNATEMMPMIAQAIKESEWLLLVLTAKCFQINSGQVLMSFAKHPLMMEKPSFTTLNLIISD